MRLRQAKKILGGKIYRWTFSWNAATADSVDQTRRGLALCRIRRWLEITEKRFPNRYRVQS